MSEYLYELKSSMITHTEKPYLTAIKQSLPQGYFVQPQVNLASIITKNGSHRYQNELYRNIDACVFDMNYKPILLIEINDATHNERHRRERDEKIKMICEDAGIQLVFFWTSYGVNPDYIYETVNRAIQNAPYYQRVAHFNVRPDDYDDYENETPPQESYNESNYPKSAWRFFIDGVKFRSKLLLIRIIAVIVVLFVFYVSVKACAPTSGTATRQIREQQKVCHMTHSQV